MGFGYFGSDNPRSFRMPGFLPDEDEAPVVQPEVDEQTLLDWQSLMSIPTRGGMDILDRGMSDMNDTPPSYEVPGVGPVMQPPSFVKGDERPQQPPQPPSKWRNIAAGIGGMIQDAAAGAGTPNIAGGGATDVFRAMSGAAQSGQQRRLMNDQRRIAEEQRRQRAESHRQEMETREQVARKQIETQQAHQELYKKQMEALAKKPNVHVDANGIYDYETKEYTRFDKTQPPSDQQKRLAILEEMGKKFPNDPAWNPNTPENQDYIKYGEQGNPKNKPKGSRSEAEITATGTDEERERLEKRAKAKRDHEIRLAQIRKKESSGEMTPAQALQWTRMYVKFNDEKERDETAAGSWRQAEIDRQKKLHPAGIIPPKVLDAVEAEYKAKMQRADATYHTNVDTADQRMNGLPGAPAVPAAAAGKSNYPVVRYQGKSYYNMGIDPKTGKARLKPVP